MLGLICFYFFWVDFVVFYGVYFIINDLIYFIDWNIITLNGRSIIITFLFDWISILFIGFVFIISSLVIVYSDNYRTDNVVPVFTQELCRKYLWLCREITTFILRPLH